MILRNFNFPNNTLTISNMGNGFTIEVLGDCHIRQIYSYGNDYGASITIRGSGTLTVGESSPYQHAIVLSGGNSNTCLMVHKGVTLNVTGTEAAIRIANTAMPDAIVLYDGVTVTGGTPASGAFFVPEAPAGLYQHTLVTGGTNTALQATFR